LGSAQALPWARLASAVPGDSIFKVAGNGLPEQGVLRYAQIAKRVLKISWNL